jgi:hypothetical protein
VAGLITVVAALANSPSAIAASSIFVVRSMMSSLVSVHAPAVVHDRDLAVGLTLDTYGHLFPRTDDRKELEEAERAFLQTTR